jgi:hypothetical protein
VIVILAGVAVLLNNWALKRRDRLHPGE